jgi:hypothetical protein
MPKTAGTSFRGSLEEHFGDRFRHDYQDYPLAHTPRARRQQARDWGEAARAGDFAGVECVHGHFLAVKYLELSERLPCTFVTWLREPVARLVSHYHYWLRAYDEDSPLVSPLHRRVVEEGWTLQQFCLAPELRDVYSEFLWGFPLDRLDFVGITEFFPEDLRYFSREILGNKVRSHTLNRRPRDADRVPEAESGGLDRSRIEAYHARDVGLYRRALGWRAARLYAPGESGEAVL